MLRFLCVAALAFFLTPNTALELDGKPLSNLYDKRTFHFNEMCQLFCGNDGLFEMMDQVLSPRIFCGLCKSKIKSTTEMTTAAPTTPTTSPPSTPTTSPPSTPTTLPPTTPTTSPTTTTPTTTPTVTTTVSTTTATNPTDTDATIT